MNYILKVGYEDINFEAALVNDNAEEVEKLKAKDIVDDLFADDAFDGFKNSFEKVIWQGIYHFVPKPLGYFGGKSFFEVFDTAMYAASNYLEEHTDDFTVKVEDEKGEHEIPGLKEGIVNLLVKTNETESFGNEFAQDIWTATVAAAFLTKFVKTGEWHIALQDEKGEIFDKVWKWPEPQKDENGKMRWFQDGKELFPVVWFDRHELTPIKCWSLCEGNADWKSFWFDNKNGIDWKQLGLSDSCIDFMYTIESIKKPDLTAIREACPIKLDVNDTQEQMLAKVEAAVLKEAEIKEDTLKIAELRKKEA